MTQNGNRASLDRTSGGGYPFISLFELLPESGELLLDLGEFGAKSRHFRLKCCYSVGSGDASGSSGRGRPLHIHLLWCLSRKQMHVAGLFCSRLPRENCRQRRFAMCQTVKSRDHIFKGFEMIHAVGAAAEFAGSLWSTEK